MAYADALRSTTWTSNDVASLIEGIWSSTYDLNWQTWTPTLGATGSMTFTGTTIRFANFLRIGKLCIVSARIDGTIGGTPSTGLTMTLPATWSGAHNQHAAVNVANAGIVEPATIGVLAASANSTITRYNGGNYTAGAATILANFIYQI